MALAIILISASALYNWLAPFPAFAAEGVNGKIVFASSRDGNFELYLMDQDGTNEVRLTNYPLNDLTPKWSPNGTKIIFVRDDTVRVIDSDGRNDKRLTPSDLRASDPSWSSDGKRIVFTVTDGQDRDIYVLEGGIAKAIADDPDLDDFEPELSPDGETIVFSSGRNASDTDIYTMNVDGTERTLVTSERANRHPAWSPDGTRIAFATDRHRSFDIYTIDKSGANATRLTNATSSESYPAWSPDGSKIVFTSTKSAKFEQVYIMNADGSKQVRLTRNQFADVSPQFHPLKPPAAQDLPILRENGLILYVSDKGGNFAEILIMNQDGTNATDLFSSRDSIDSTPKWAPDGSKIAFVSGKESHQEITLVRPEGSIITSFGMSTSPYSGLSWSPMGNKLAFSKGDQYHSFIFTINSDGTDSRRLTFDEEADREPSWSPDGEKIAFTRDFGQGSTDIFVMTKDGKDIKKITSHPGPDYFPRWSPEGDQIAFVTERNGNKEIYVMNPDGKRLRNLSNNTADDFSPSWSPDGTKIIFVSDRSEDGQDIHMMDFDGRNVVRLTRGEANETEPDFGPLTGFSLPGPAPEGGGDDLLQPLRISPLTVSSEYPPPLDAIAAGRPAVISARATNENLDAAWNSVAILQVRDATGVTLHIESKKLAVQAGQIGQLEFKWTPPDAKSYDLILFVISDSVHPRVIGSKVSSTLTVPAAVS